MTSERLIRGGMIARNHTAPDQSADLELHSD